MLTVTRPADLPEGATDRIVFGAEGGSVGRGGQCDMVLPDPTNLVSRRHLDVIFRDGGFEAVDQSSNGLYVNTSPDPVGKGRSTPLREGDRLGVGEYELTVEALTLGEAGAQDDFPEIERSFSGNPFASGGAKAGAKPAPPPPPPPSRGDDEADPFGLPADQSRGDPFADLEAEFEEDDEWPPREFRQVAPSIGAEEEENEGPLIPDDDDFLADLVGDSDRPAEPDHAPGWNTPLSEAMKPARSESPLDSTMAEPPEPEPEPEPRKAPPPRVEPAPPAQGGDAMAAFWEAAGLDPRLAGDACGPDRAGAMFGALVRGLWEVLRARTAFKEEFRVERTMLGAANNNPVKFAIDPEQALEGLARPAARGFMAPLEAVEESFDDIRRHELAMMAAMHRALSHVLEEFDPETLESKLEGMSLLDALPGGRRARYWDLYVKHYAEIAKTAEDIFEGALGREFVAAYEKASHGNRGGEE